MADLKLGETCTALIKFISASTAHTFVLPFDADKVVFYNLTKYGTTGQTPVSIWFKGMTAAYALQEQVIADNGATTNTNLKLTTTNGFTQANDEGGAPDYHKLISGVSQANPCVVTTSTAHGYQTDQIVRITDLGSDMPTARGMDQINNKRFRIVVLTSDTFSLYDPVSGDAINSTSYTAWVSGGRVDLETRVLSLNNPQVSPYAVTPYVPNQFVYDPITYQLTAGTAVMGADNDVFRIECYKFGQVIDLGDLLT
jgi:hypothetical protein